ncbi:hypothetical protein K3495_g5032 [Podosphaera aphanis]|nr:hypothetical protein K3495_g5032 [Podosphaera aphanis]
MTETSPLVYAELLSNIKQISILASLDTPSDASTSLKLSDDGHQVTLFHKGKSLTLRLPGQSCSTFKLQPPIQGSTGISWRLPLAADSKYIARENALNSDVPWSAKIMKGTTELLCQACGGMILKKESVLTWKDLPGEDWAEMMDFWHCHKPNVEENGSNGVSCDQDVSKNVMIERGYGANSRFVAQHGVGFVDITTFLLDPQDCTGVLLPRQFGPTTDESRSVRCAKCATELGYYDAALTGLKLWKWKLRNPKLACLLKNSTSTHEPISLRPARRGQTFLAPIIVAAAISAKMASRLVSKFLLTTNPVTARPHVLYLWIFGASLRFSCSALPPSETSSSFNGHPALKTFWKTITYDVADSLRESVGVEELSFPLDAVIEIEQALKNSASLLPPTSQRFEDWNIGLLDRYEE